MVSNDKSICQNCGSKLKRYDKVSRIVRTKGGKTSWIEIERFRCPVCGQIHRELPDYIFPYKQYEAEVIRGVLEGFITCETYGYEDYPCEMTMIRWRNSQLAIPWCDGDATFFLFSLMMGIPLFFAKENWIYEGEEDDGTSREETYSEIRTKSENRHIQSHKRAAQYSGTRTSRKRA